MNKPPYKKTEWYQIRTYSALLSKIGQARMKEIEREAVLMVREMMKTVHNPVDKWGYQPRGVLKTS